MNDVRWFAGGGAVLEKVTTAPNPTNERFLFLRSPAVTATPAPLSFGSQKRDWLAPMKQRLDAIAAHLDGWNGYSAPAPQPVAVARANEFLEVLHQEDLAPIQIAASAIGGVGVTFGQQGRQGYVEFSNTGSIHSILYSLNDADGPYIWPMRSEGESYRAFISAMREFFDGRDSRGNATTTEDAD
jgi:hypothetical protein